MTLKELLEQHTNDYVCVEYQSKMHEVIALGQRLLETIDEFWLNEECQSIDENGADYYDIYVSI